MHAEDTTKIKNRHGFHVRPSTTFSLMAAKYKSAIKVLTEQGIEADGKILMSLMTLGASFGTKITVIANGEDAEEAVKALIAHINDSFGGIE